MSFNYFLQIQPLIFLGILRYDLNSYIDNFFFKKK